MKKLYIYTFALLSSLLGVSLGSAVAQSITVSGVPNVICANEAFTIGYSGSGFTANAGNAFIAELSNSLGDFSSGFQIGAEVTQSLDGTIYVVIPTSAPDGFGYRIRVIATDPDLGLGIGLDNGLDITLNCTTRDYYWVNGGGNWSDLSHWEYTIDDVVFFNAFEPPTSNDNVNFDDLSFPDGGTLNVDIQAYCNDMYWSPDVVTSPQLLTVPGGTINVRGDLIMANGVYKDVYRFAFNSEKSYISIDLADNTTKLNSNTYWDGQFDFNGTGSYDLLSPLRGERLFLNSVVTFYTNDFSIDLTQGLELGDGTFYAGSSTISLANLTQGGGNTFNSETSTILFDKGYGQLSLNNGRVNKVIFNEGDFNIYGNDSILDLTVMPDAKLKVSPFTNFNVTGTFQALGSRSKMIDIQSTDPGDPSTLKLSSATALINFVILQDNTVTSTSAQPVSATNSIDNGNNTNWSIAAIAPQSYFWIGGTGNWSDVNHWVTTDGGTTLRTDPPGPVDNVNFTTNSFPNGGHITIDIIASCNDFIWTDGSTSPSIGGSYDFPLTVRGNFSLAAGVTRSILDIDFESVGSNVVTFSDNQIYTQGNISFEGTGSWSLQDSVSAGSFDVFGGTLSTNNHNLNLNSVGFYGGISNLGSSTVTANRINGTGTALNSQTSTFIFNDGGINNYDAAYNNVIFNGDDCYINNDHTFEGITINAGADIRIQSGSTQNINQSLTINGTRSSMATLRSSSPGNQAFFIANLGAVVTANYVNLMDNSATGTTFAAANSLDNGNNPGWNIIPIVPMNYYWIGGGGNWSDNANHWSSWDGGAADMVDPPGPLDDVFFTGFSSFVLVNTDTITIDIPSSVHNMTWQDGSAKPHLDQGLNFNPLTITGSLFMANGVSKSINSINFDSNELGKIIDMKDNLGFLGNIWFKGGGSWTSVDSLAASQITLEDGTFKMLAGTHLNTSFFRFYYPQTGLETQILDVTNSEFTFSQFSDDGGIGQLFSSGSTFYVEPFGYIQTNLFTYNDVILKGGCQIYGSNTFNSLVLDSPSVNLLLQSGSTSTINSQLTLLGEDGLPALVNSDNPGFPAYLSMPVSANVTADFIHLYDNGASGGALFTATNSAKFSIVTGWTGVLTGQTISLATNDVPFSDGSATLNGSSTSGLGVQYSLTTGDASIAGNVVTPNSAGLVEILATQSGDAIFAEALPARRFIHFNATTDPNELGNMKEASYVVGQVDFESNDFFFDVNKTPQGRKAFVTNDGKLITTGRNRALIWNQVPGMDDVPADIVLGQKDFISTDYEINASTIYGSAYAVGMTDNGRLLIADSYRILIWNTFPTENGQPADMVIGQADLNSFDRAASADRFNGPPFFVISPDQKLIVSDISGDRVLIFNQIPTLSGASADVVIGQADFTTIDAGSGAQGINFPSYPAVAADGRLFIPDADNHRILVYNSIPTSSGVAADGVLGQPNLDSNEAGLSPTLFSRPYSVDISRTGKMAIADRGNQRVLIYNSIPADNTVEPDYVLGQPDYFTSGANTGGVSGRGIFDAYGIYWDPAENLYLGDLQNNRFLVWGAPDFDVPAIENSTIPTPYVSESGVNAVFTLVERSGLQQADAYFRFISSPDPSFIKGGLVELSENVWSFDLTGIDIVDEPLGMEFYIDIKDGYGNAFDNQSNPQSTNIGYPDGLPITEFGVGSATTDYRLFAVPLELQDKDAKNVFNEVFAGTYDKSKMRIFSYAGGAATTFTEYNSGFSNLEVGRGYFGLAAAATSVTSGVGQTVPYYNQGLGDGWQLIGNPYDFSLNWSDIEAASSFDASQVQAPRGYDDGNYSTGQAVIGPGEGVFVLNKTGGTLNLVFPVANNVGDRIMEQEDNRNDLSSDSWEVRFLNGIGDKEHQIGAVGMELDADQSIDRYDMAVPPAIGSMGSIIFNHPEYFVSGFDVDIKPTSTSDNWAFTFSAGENADEEQEISWDNSYYGYNTPDLYLVDKTHFEVINMKENESYQFKYSGDTKFEVYYGENALSALLPEKLEVQTPYPNPFNESVKINIGLPIASNDYKVVVAIYNTMGKQVTTLNNADMNGGFYSFNWAGTNDSGLEVADGIYAYRIVTSGEISSVVTGKVIKK